MTFSSIPGADDARASLVAKVSCALPTGAIITNGATATSNSADSNQVNNIGTTRIVVLNPPPEISRLSVDQASLSPPDGRMVLVTVDYDVRDNCAVGSCKLIVSTDGKPHGFEPDFAVLDDHHVVLRAESNGSNAARVYKITVQCTDTAGAVSSRHVTVVVPQRGA